MPEPIPGDFAPRLREAADYVRDCRERYSNAVKARNALVIEAVDSGFGNHAAARAIGVKQPQIVRILTQADYDLVN